MSKRYTDQSRDRDNRKTEGLKQRRLKDEARWRFRPNRDYMGESQEEDDLGDFEDDYHVEDYR